MTNTYFIQQYFMVPFVLCHYLTKLKYEQEHRMYTEQQKKLDIRHYVYVYQYPNKINNSLKSVQFQLI